jgi:hypothetical protein
VLETGMAALKLCQATALLTGNCGAWSFFFIVASPWKAAIPDGWIATRRQKKSFDCPMPEIMYTLSDTNKYPLRGRLA